MACDCRLCEALGTGPPPAKPSTIAGYEELDLVLRELQAQEPEDWWHVSRWYIAHDLFYLTTRVSMLRGLINPISNLPLFERQWTLDRDRELEDDPARPMMMGRGMGKTSKRNMQNIQRVLKWPDIAICLFSFQRAAAIKRLASTRVELENPLLVGFFPEVLFETPKDPDHGSDSWSLTSGLNVRRETSRPEHTFEAHALRLHTLPTGSHYNVLDTDDAEDDKVVGSPGQIADLKLAYAQAMHLWSPPVERPFTGTPYHQAGLVMERIKKAGDRAMIYPGEDLETPGDGPLGGKPVYFTAEELQALFDEINDPDSYAMQVCLSTSKGAGRQFSRTQWQIYDEDPLEFARRCFVYIMLDPTRGLGDPAAHWVWGTTQDRKFAWLDASMKVLAPGEQLAETWRLFSKWNQVSLGVRHIRIEEAGQANFAEPTREYLRRHGVHTEVFRCPVPPTNKTQREWTAWHPLAEERRLLMPRSIWGVDEKEKPLDLVEYFMAFEWEEFPRPSTDNMLDAGALISYPASKLGPGAELMFPNRSDVEFVDVDEDAVRSGAQRSYLSQGVL